MGGYHKGGGAVYWNFPHNECIGCRKVSEACLHCYAETVCKRFDMNGDGTFDPKRRHNAKMPKRGVVFVCNMSDFMGEWMGDEEVEGIVRKCASGNGDNRVSLFLTKRHRRYDTLPLFSSSGDINCANSYFGVTAETQQRWDERKESIFGMKRRGFNTWVSVEPMLEPIDLGLTDCGVGGLVDWVVVGAESGSSRRRCDIAWIRDVVEQCRRASVNVFVKQLDFGTRVETDIEKFPEDLKIREKPWGCKFDEGIARRAKFAIDKC